MSGGPQASNAGQMQTQQQQPGGPRTKSFDNPSASSTASSGVGTSISSLNATNQNLAGLNASNMNTSAPPTPNVVKKYYEQKYGSTTNMNATGAGGGVGVGGPLNDKMMMMQQQQQQPTQPTRNGAPRNFPTPTGTSSSNMNMNMGGFPQQQQQQSSSFLNMNMNNNQNQNSPLGTGISSLTSQFASGIANLKLTASNFQANKLTSKFMNPFSS